MSLREGLLASFAVGSLASAQRPRRGSMPVCAGEWLARSLDRLDVEHHWLRGHEHIAWRTGFPLLMEHGKGLTPLGRGRSQHCSAFAAAAADALGIYLLHPPEHSHVLLANAQYDWLASAKGRKAGWRPVGDPLDAAATGEPRRICRGGVQEPSSKVRRPHRHHAAGRRQNRREVKAKGPQITQAGFNNYRSAPLAKGFDHHPGAWEPGGRGGVKFFTHERIDGGRWRVAARPRD